MIFMQKIYVNVTCSIIILVIILSTASFHISPTLKPEEEETEVWRVNSEGGGSCRALFTITEVPQPDTITTAHLLNYSESNFTNSSSLTSHRGTPSHSYRNWDVAVAARQVRHLLQQRSSTSGASTTNYRSLAALLPTFLFFQDNSTENDKDNQRKEGQTPILVTTSRIGTMGGVLPYVPCAIAPYNDPASVTACFRKRLVEKSSLWMAFMGDSKIRKIFLEFLRRTNEEFNYVVKFPDGTEPFREVFKKYGKPRIDMEASTKAVPNLNITYSYRLFMEIRPSWYLRTPEVQQLRKWAQGEESPPDLLVVGYSSWMLLRMKMKNDYPHDLLDLLMELHRVVVPLLEQISQKTRVLVLPQSRYKPHSEASIYAYLGVAYGDASFNWSETEFQYYLQRNRKKHLPVYTSQAVPTHPRSALWWNKEETFLKRPKAHFLRPQSAMTRRDHLVPSETDAGLWWWDTSLPLNLAGINECEELYRRGLASHPLYSSTELLCSDGHHADKATEVDLVTMILNLMCNSVLKSHSRYCCH